MADKEKKKKTKKKEDKGDAKKEEAAPTPEAEPTPEKQATPPKSETPKSPKSPSGSSRASRGSKKAKRSGSSVFSLFTQKQVAEFKEGFALIDHDKDGIIGKKDLEFIYDQVGKLVNEKELDAMLAENEVPLNFTQFLLMFASRMQGGGSDEDSVVIAAFNTFDNGQGKIDGERLKHALVTWCERFTPKEANEAFDHMYIDDKGFVDIESLINMLTGKDEDDD